MRTVGRSNEAAKIIISESKQNKKLQTVKLLKQASFDCLHSDVTEEVEIKYKYNVFMFVLTPITDSGHCNVHGLDITEHKKVEKALNGSVGELSLVNEKLGVVGTLTRHDVRNKLSVVAGNLFIAKELLPPDHETMKHLEKAEPAFDQIE